MNNIPLGWSCLQFKYAFKAVPFTTKIKQKEYALTGQYPIIDQGEYFIGGYSDNNYGLITDIPVIAFGDHTRRFKYIDFPFIPGADGLKIYKPIYSETKFSFYQCLTLEFPNRGYARHNALLQKCHFYLPPLEEQGRIVEKIEELFSDIDNGIKDLKTAQAQIKQYRQSVLKSAFEGKLYKTSEWKEVDIKKIISREKNALKAGPFGSALKKEIYVANGYKIYGQEQVISQNPFLGNYYINEEKYQQLISCSVKPLDILISLVGTIGKVLILPKGIEKGIINPRLIKVTLDVDQYLPAFFKLYFESQYLRSLFKTKAHGATMDVLNLSILKEIPFPLPTIPEQQQIVAEIEKRFLVADELEKAVNEGLEKTDKLKQSILKKAFEGKLVPQDPNDEPASALLDRIKKEQKPTKGKKK